MKSVKSLLSVVFLTSSSALTTAALVDNFDTGTYPDSGTGWSSGWSSNVSTATVSNTSPLNGGGSYLSVTTGAASSTTGILRSIGGMAASTYTLTFDWRYDSNIADFNAYEDRIHIGATNGTATANYGTSTNYAWIIGVVGGDNGGTLYEDGMWYFYDNASTTTDGGFTTNNMRITNVSLTADKVYSFSVTVDPLAQKYSVIMSDINGVLWTETGMDFRNQTGDPSTFSNLVFGGANTGTGNTLNWSIDSINIVPEPSTALLAGLAGILCLRRNRSEG